MGGGGAYYHTNWGVITGTICFNRNQTQLATSAGTLAAFAAFLPPPSNVVISLNLARVGAHAAIARYGNRCLMMRSDLFVSDYSGVWCS